MRPSQNLPLPLRIYPLFNNYMRPTQNQPLPPRIYAHNIPPPPLFDNYIYLTNFFTHDTPRIYPSLPEYTLFSTNLYLRSSQNQLLAPRIYPPFQQLYATLPESTPPSDSVGSYVSKCGPVSFTFK